MKRKRKLVTGIVPLGRPSLKSRKEARKVTASYHIIQNELSAINSDVSLSASARSVKKSELEGQLEEIGGIDRYQEASQISTQHFKTSRWVLSQIAAHHSSNGKDKEQGQGKKNNEEEDGTATNTSCSSSGGDGKEKEKKEKEPKPKVLEVGAINIQLQQVSHLDVRSIDINSQHPYIEEMNFFDIEPEGAFDVVVCSMVVNCVHEVARRGEMLARLRMHLRTPHQSLLLLVLPSRCIRSKHLGAERFLRLCTALGMAVVEVKETPRLLFYTLRATSGASSSAGWIERTRAALCAGLTPSLRTHFADSRYANVPSHEFCMGFTSEFLQQQQQQHGGGGGGGKGKGKGKEQSWARATSEGARGRGKEYEKGGGRPKKA